ncbi:MAG: 5'-methylthioadenosine/adenosylhomocysteine nucleosidase [Treponema sp.]|jgi:adenosylhomocysteine nucleosidase|nr:5'-methylthioadenosine/adenosylhomocysteine nucleosidase [Treponema sp.]
MIGIIGAMEAELALLKNALANPQTRTIGGFTFISGLLEQKSAVLLQCGIGKVNAAVGCALLITTYQPEALINTGSAGGIDPALTFGDTVISEGLIQHDVDLTSFGYAPGQLPAMPAIFPVPEDLIRRAEQAVADLKRDGLLPPSFKYSRGLIGSGDVFMDKEDRIQALRARFPGIRAVEMEGAAIAQTCFLFKTPALILRSLSDIAGAQSPVAFEEFLPLASKHSAEILRRIIRAWPGQRGDRGAFRPPGGGVAGAEPPHGG